MGVLGSWFLVLGAWRLVLGAWCLGVWLRVDGNADDSSAFLGFARMGNGGQKNKEQRTKH